MTRTIALENCPITFRRGRARLRDALGDYFLPIFRQPRAPTTHCRVKPSRTGDAVSVNSQRVQSVFPALERRSIMGYLSWVRNRQNRPARRLARYRPRLE